MIKEDRQKLREAAVAAQRGVRERQRERDTASPIHLNWSLQTSNSFRRVGQFGDGDVLCAVTQRPDGHPDLNAAPGVLDYLIAAQPFVVLDLLDQIDAAEVWCARVQEVEQKLKYVEVKWRETVATIEAMVREAMEKSASESP